MYAREERQASDAHSTCTPAVVYNLELQLRDPPQSQRDLDKLKVSVKVSAPRTDLCCMRTQTT